MIDKLEEMLAGFPGQCAWSQCFCHIINLVANVLLCQFEPLKPKKKKNNTDPDKDKEEDPSLDDWDKELRSLMEDLDFDNELLDGQIEDNEVLWDVIEEIDDTSRADIQQEVCPVKMMLLKVSQ